MATIISIIVAAVLAILLVDRILANRKLSEQMARQQETNLELLKRIPVSDAGSAEGPKPLTVDTIVEAVRFNGFIPEKNKETVSFRAHGENYQIEAERLPLFFIVKGFNVNTEEWDLDLMREAAAKMSDEIAIVKADVSDDGKTLRFFVGAHDRNYESFRDNLTSYLSILESGQRFFRDEYDRMEKEQENAALSTQPIVPSARTDTKVMS